ncbi:cell surface glycoprotein 1-like [Culex pipiens pallens]|uniref:cell surface glycoprotein 1-like n=1 Tax=Culex pipiens pallens TaxID=42434 RepID=UPI0022AA31A4|nr:cell surface glycoprotein 1-like [Culex pipiens pallens]
MEPITTSELEEASRLRENTKQKVCLLRDTVLNLQQPTLQRLTSLKESLWKLYGEYNKFHGFIIGSVPEEALAEQYTECELFDQLFNEAGVPLEEKLIALRSNTAAEPSTADNIEHQPEKHPWKSSVPTVYRISSWSTPMASWESVRKELSGRTDNRSRPQNLEADTALRSRILPTNGPCRRSKPTSASDVLESEVVMRDLFPTIEPNTTNKSREPIPAIPEPNDQTELRAFVNPSNDDTGTDDVPPLTEAVHSEESRTDRTHPDDRSLTKFKDDPRLAEPPTAAQDMVNLYNPDTSLAAADSTLEEGVDTDKMAKAKSSTAPRRSAKSKQTVKLPNILDQHRLEPQLPTAAKAPDKQDLLYPNGDQQSNDPRGNNSPSKSSPSSPSRSGTRNGPSCRRKPKPAHILETGVVMRDHLATTVADPKDLSVSSVHNKPRRGRVHPDDGSWTTVTQTFECQDIPEASRVSVDNPESKVVREDSGTQPEVELMPTAPPSSTKADQHDSQRALTDGDARTQVTEQFPANLLIELHQKTFPRDQHSFPKTAQLNSSTRRTRADPDPHLPAAAKAPVKDCQLKARRGRLDSDLPGFQENQDNRFAAENPRNQIDLSSKNQPRSQPPNEASQQAAHREPRATMRISCDLPEAEATVNEPHLKKKPTQNQLKVHKSETFPPTEKSTQSERRSPKSRYIHSEHPTSPKKRVQKIKALQSRPQLNRSPGLPLRWQLILAVYRTCLKEWIANNLPNTDNPARIPRSNNRYPSHGRGEQSRNPIVNLDGERTPTDEAEPTHRKCSVGKRRQTGHQRSSNKQNQR